MNNTYNIPVEIRQLITSNQAFHHRIVPIANQDDTVVFKTDLANTSKLKEELEVLLDWKIELEQIPEVELTNYLSKNYRRTTTSVTESLDYETNFLWQLLNTAKDYNSSDIHLEIYEDKCRVRFRLDGKLKEQYSISKNEYPKIINQIKIQAGLDISQRRLAQDGRISIKSETEDFDIRVSSLPTLYGEKIVMRILKRETQNVDLMNLGFTEMELSIFLESVRKPNGIILISGPTGSGKTTTLYGTLKILNQESTNILTIEDPIEYTLDGVNQVQLKEDIGLDFPAALRTFLRQDPDIIMVGEIRDEKTASMAIKAALTGHLVLSTIHTNSAVATISRLQDMGIPNYLIADTLNLSMAQRLVRVLCPDCKSKSLIEDKLFPENFQIPKTLHHHYQATGCDNCHHTGYKGRKAIYEIVPVSSTVESLIRQEKFDMNDISKLVNLPSLKTNALRLLGEGETSIDEVYPLLTNNF